MHREARLDFTGVLCSLVAQQWPASAANLQQQAGKASFCLIFYSTNHGFASHGFWVLREALQGLHGDKVVRCFAGTRSQTWNVALHLGGLRVTCDIATSSTDCLWYNITQRRCATVIDPLREAFHVGLDLCPGVVIDVRKARDLHGGAVLTRTTSQPLHTSLRSLIPGSSRQGR